MVTVSQPADTTMMRVVHDALRRDLRRVRSTVLRSPAPDARQRDAIRDHLSWVLAFLEAHHRSEDEGLYPLVRERDAAAAALLDDMAHEHDAVAAAAEHLGRCAAAYVRDDDRDAFVAAIDQLTDLLFPHLLREEEETMPVVSRSITHDEWTAIEQRYNLEGKTARQLGREGHWLIDDASPADRDLVLHLVPPVARVVLRYGFGPSYRRARRAWLSPKRRVQRDGIAAVTVAADVDAVWDVVRDPTRVGEWSHECLEATWIDGATEAVAGARFRGRNRHGLVRWGRVCEVVDIERYSIVWRTVPTRLYPDSTRWALRLEPTPEGTTIEQSFEVVKGSALEPLYATLITSHRDRTEALIHDLIRIGAVAQAGHHTNAPEAVAAWGVQSTNSSPTT